jgi:hypothetical protein
MEKTAAIFAVILALAFITPEAIKIIWGTV